MLAVDTNVIVRYLTADDPAQAARARALIDGNDVFVCTTVLLETEWVLRSVYGFDATQLAERLSAFAGLPRISLEGPDEVAAALNCLSQGLDFADALHLCGTSAFDAFITFDKNLIRNATRMTNIRARQP